MSLFDLIGFLFGVAFMIVMGIKKSQEERRKRENPEGYRREKLEREHRLTQLLHDEEVEDEFTEESEEEEEHKHRPPPLPPRRPVQIESKPLITRAPLPPVDKAGDNYDFKPNLSDYKIKSSIDQRTIASKLDSRYQQDSEDKAYLSPYESKTYDVISTASNSRVGKLLENLPSKKTMVILHEILGLPKGLK